MPTTSFEVTGVGQYIAMLRSLQGKELESATRKSLSKSAQKIIAPAIAGARGWKYGGHGGKYPTKGLLGQRRKVTSRRVRTRQGEFVAISTKPRGFAGAVSAWVVRGTKPHVIAASEARALSFNGRLVSAVQHPGAKPTDYIHDAVQGKEGAVLHELALDLIKQAAAAGHTPVIP